MGQKLHRTLTARAALLAAALCLVAPARAEDTPGDPAVRRAIDAIHSSSFMRLNPAVKREPGAAELGGKLFFDPRLSGDGTLSCASCHDPEKAWTDGLPVARGKYGSLGRNSPSVLDLRGQTLFFWDGRVSLLDEQPLRPLQDHQEMGLPLDELVARLREVPEYKEGFTKAFGPPGVTAERAGSAIAAFLETLETPLDSPFDRARQDPSALSPAAKRGLLAFVGKARCVTCHTGPDLTDRRFHDIGLARIPGREDPGRWGVVQITGAKDAFRTPGLRNAALTGPYMHDGRFATLEETVEFYARGGDRRTAEVYRLQPLPLTKRDKKDLVAFLESLTTSMPKIAVPVPPAGKFAARAKDAVAPADARPPVASPPQTDRPEPVSSAVPSPHARPALAKACSEKESDKKLSGIIDALSPDPGAPLDDELVQIRGSVYDDLVRAQVYRSLDAGDDSPCAALSGARQCTGISQSAEYFCRDWYRELALIKAAAEKPETLPKVCLDGLKWSYQRLEPARAKAACDAIVAHHKDPAALCDKLIPEFVAPRQRRACELEYSLLAGIEFPCPSGPGFTTEWTTYRCVEYTRYHRALKSGNIEDCGKAQICRALLGKAAEFAEGIERTATALACEPPPVRY